ncbi:hypothetical protein Tco_0790594 [Tanacetum coccineum]
MSAPTQCCDMGSDGYAYQIITPFFVYPLVFVTRWRRVSIDAFRLSKRKFVIVCHEKVVRIPLEGDEILRVHSERTQGVVKTLMNTKSCKMKVSYDLVIFRREHQCRLLRRGAWSSFEVSVGITEEGEVSGVKDKILATPSETSKVENAPAEMLRDLDQQMEKRADDGCTYGLNCIVEIRGSSLIGPELVQQMTNKVVLVKVKPKAAGDRQKSYVDNRRKWLEFEVGDRVMLKVSPWKGDIRFGKKGKLAPRFLGPVSRYGRGSGSWMFLFVGRVCAMSTLVWRQVVAVRYLVKVSWIQRLSKRKFMMVCHEKVVRIQLEEEEHGVLLKLVLELLRKEKFYAKFTKSEKRRAKLRRVRAMSMTIQSSVKDKILATPSETSKVENAPVEMLRDLDQQMEKRADDGCTLWIKLYNAAESISDAIRFEYCLASSSGWTNIRCASFEALYGRNCISPVIWAEIGGSSLIGPELVQKTTNKVVLVKEKPKGAGDRQKSYADNRRKPLEFEEEDPVMLKVSPWKGDIRFGKKGKLAPRQFLFDELRGQVVNDIVTQLKVLISFLEEGEVYVVGWFFLFGVVMLLFVPLGGQAKLLAVRYRVKVCWNSKRGPEFT